MGQNNRRNEEDGDPIPIFNRFVIQLLMTMFIIEFVKGALLLTILPVYMGAMLGLSTSLIGWSLALQYVGDNVFRSPMGWVRDRL
jgi:DHA1 family multidrug resistance protein-like MFS transporter